MKKKLLLLAAAALAGMAPARRRGHGQGESLFHLCRPGRRLRLVLSARSGPPPCEEKLGDKVETAYLESVPEGADSERAIERFARSGCNIIFTTSFGYMDPTNKVAKDFPDVKFEHATGYKRESIRTWRLTIPSSIQGRYVIGQIAAKMSKTGMAGYIASFPIPEVVQGINSFMLGAQSINPDFKLKVVWVNTWFDPGKEADAAKALLDQGVDILTQHTDSTAPMQVAAERGAHAFGQASDMIKFGPETQLTSIIDDWGPYYVERVKPFWMEPGKEAGPGPAWRRATS
jgi:basic membrane protein A